MICISVTPKSRQLAKVDIYNAARQADLVEVCLDHLIKEPDFKDLFENPGKPLIASCRRDIEGGQWGGTEEERLLLLRRAIVAGPAWIELEIDIARQVPRFGSTKRLISFTRLDEPLGNIDAILERAEASDADAVKLTGPTPTLDAAWPLLAATTKRRGLPVVGIGLGRPGLTFSLLGLRHGAPWIYAALERGMESHAGQASVHELDTVYHWRDIKPTTTFLGVAGFDACQTAVAAVINAACRELGLDVRCLPVQLDRLDNFAQMFDILRIPALFLDKPHGSRILSVRPQQEEAVKHSQYADLLLKPSDGWHAYNSLWRGALQALEGTLAASSRTGDAALPLAGRTVLLVGSDPTARSLAYGITSRKGILSVTAGDDDRARLLARMFDARFVPFAQIYDGLYDVIVVVKSEFEVGRQKLAVNPSILRPNMTVLDMTAWPRSGDFADQARSRGCRVVDTTQVFEAQIAAQFQAATGKPLPSGIVARVLQELD